MYTGSDDCDSEELMAYELGYRVQPRENLSIDVAAFYNDYDKLRAVEIGPPNLVGSVLEVELLLDNKLSGETYGVEIAADWQIKEWWKLMAGYSYLETDLDLDSDSTAEASADVQGAPQNMFHIRSYVDLPHNLEFDAALYYVDRLEKTDTSSYVRTDLRLGWHPTENLEVSVAAQNIFDDQHEEFASGYFNPVTEVERSIYGQVTYRF
jgi:iron complex outermembrane receptor protein